MKKLIYLLAGSFLVLASCKQEAKKEESPEPMDKTEKRFGGLALYTVRDAMAEDPRGTLKKVADMGYAYIEAAGYEDGKYYGMEPLVFKAYLDSLGLEGVSSHQSAITLENGEQMLKDAKEAGFKYLVVPIPPMGHFWYDNETQTMGMSGTVEEVNSILNTLGKQAHEIGIELLYHNHDFELRPNEDGVVPMDYFIENTDPKYVNFQMDLFWAVKAGADPIAYFEKAPGRIKAWHIKDMDTEGKFAPVGQGTIDFAAILAEKSKAGMEYYFVEQDQTWGLDPLEAIAISRKGLEKHGFE